MTFDEAHGPQLWCTGDGDGPGVAEETVKGVHIVAQAAFDVIDGVDEA